MTDETGLYDDDLDDLDEEPLEPHEEIFEEWLELGWFDVLPGGVMTITASFPDLTTTRLDFDEVAAEAVQAGMQYLDDDPLWPVLSLEDAAEEGLDEGDDYQHYLAGVLAQRDRWNELVSRVPEYAVSTLNGLADLLVGWGLLREADGRLELVEQVPDPLEVLPLTEETIANMVLDRMEPEIEAVEDVLHDFLYHGSNDTLVTSLQRLAQQADVDVEVARMAVALMVSTPTTGLSAERSGPIDAEGIERLKEHQKFTLRVDRDAPGFSEHEH